MADTTHTPRVALEKAEYLLRDAAHELMDRISLNGAPDWEGEPETATAYQEHIAAADALAALGHGTPLLRGDGEQLTRFCPGCGSVGEVESKFRDCCPDGAGARLIPASLAQKCHDLFRLALVGASQPEFVESQPNAALADGWLNPEDLAALERFNECAEDSEADGHDVPKERMKRLAELGAVQARGFGLHEITAFGSFVLGSQFARRPLETTDECNARLGREHRAKLEMPDPPSQDASKGGV